MKLYRCHDEEIDRCNADVSYTIKNISCVTSPAIIHNYKHKQNWQLKCLYKCQDGEIDSCNADVSYIEPWNNTQLLTHK